VANAAEHDGKASTRPRFARTSWRWSCCSRSRAWRSWAATTLATEASLAINRLVEEPFVVGPASAGIWRDFGW
jgi:hypothetical protein